MNFPSKFKSDNSFRHYNLKKMGVYQVLPLRDQFLAAILNTVGAISILAIILKVARQDDEFEYEVDRGQTTGSAS